MNIEKLRFIESWIEEIQNKDFQDQNTQSEAEKAVFPLLFQIWEIVKKEVQEPTPLSMFFYFVRKGFIKATSIHQFIGEDVCSYDRVNDAVNSLKSIGHFPEDLEKIIEDKLRGELKTA